MASAAMNALSYFMLIGKLKGIRRTGWVLRGIPDPERISGHMYRMSVMAMMLGNDPDAGVNKDKCIRMALVHDMGECIVGDITPTCGVSKEEKFRRESEAMDSLARLVDNVSAAEFKSLWEEYEAQSSPESKVVKDLDMFDMILQSTRILQFNFILMCLQNHVKHIQILDYFGLRRTLSFILLP
uniref:5'-deoxynucleotidase HDDC2 n=1 Tax=Amblyomma maculatum TaxID=34609 RepID=G3MQS3_AMBMU